MMNHARTLFLSLAALALGASGAAAQTVLKASHQFPGGKGDPRDEMVQIIEREDRGVQRHPHAGPRAQP